MLVRYDEDGCLYLYDFVRTKKKRASRLSNSCTVVNFVSMNDDSTFRESCQ
ncbi:MAG: hypothetical protein IJ439_06730 [Tyzzerella sp.]|nr:hypothetical protein [Tyzzerella sp.]